MYANVNAAPMVAGANMPPMVAGVSDMPYAPVYGYGYGPTHGGLGNSFLLIVVLFILLIIVGCSFPKC